MNQAFKQALADLAIASRVNMASERMYGYTRSTVETAIAELRERAVDQLDENNHHHYNPEVGALNNKRADELESELAVLTKYVESRG